MKILITTLAILSLSLTGRAAAPNDELRETTDIIQALKAHFVDREKLDVKSLNDASVAGILKALGEGAQILTAEQAATGSVADATMHRADEALARAELIEPDIGYIRIADVTPATPAALDAELKKFAEQKVEGYILDLRFADGTNYDAAASVASRFLANSQQLFALKRSDGEPKLFESTTTSNEATDAPLMLLVNSETRGSAEAVAGALRALDRGIVIGNQTAGRPASTRDVPLGDGRVLRVATSKISFPNGTETFPLGLMPDIPVKIEQQIEQDVVWNIQTNLTLSASLQPRIKKKGLSEAELVKAFRGEPLELTEAGATNTEAGELQKVRDVVLQRAVDVLKGIRVLLSLQ
jgi:C-terminal processing protease CtpA/Prc